MSNQEKPIVVDSSTQSDGDAISVISINWRHCWSWMTSCCKKKSTYQSTDSSSSSTEQAQVNQLPIVVDSSK